MLSVPGDQWINDLFGFKETVDSVMKNIELEKKADGVWLKSKINGNSFNSGFFSLNSISSYDHLIPRGNGKLHIICGNEMKSRRLELVDIQTAQSFPEFEGATFQIASNFNCLEFGSDICTAAMGVSVYGVDATQGPAGAVSCGQGAIYRNYFTDVNPGYIGQIDKEINLLSRTPIHLRHGKAIIDEKECERLRNLNFDWDNLDNIQIGVHSHLHAIMSRSNKKWHLKINEKPQYINQIFTAALAYNSYTVMNQFTLDIGSKILRADYCASILAGWDNSLKWPDYPGSNKLFLTLVGGGFFRNPISMVAEAIKFNKQKIIDSGLDVYLMCFNKSLFDESYKVLSSVVDETKGSIIEA